MTMTITNSRIALNKALQSWSVGGGIANMSGTLTVNHCSISNNQANLGGGVATYGTGNAQISKSVIRENSALSEGGGLYVRDGGTINVQASTVTSNVAPTGPVAHRHNNTGTISITNTSLPDYDLGGSASLLSEIGNILPPTNPLPVRYPKFVMEVINTGKNLDIVYQYNRAEAAKRAIQLSRENFNNFPQDSVSSVVGYIDANLTRARRNYSNILFHNVINEGTVNEQVRTGSSLFISEMIHCGGHPMSIDLGDDLENPDCTLFDQQDGGGGYTQRGWRSCPPETSATKNWKHHPSIAAYFDSLPTGEMIGTVGRSQITPFIWLDGFGGFPLAGTLKTDNVAQDAKTALIARFATGGDLSTVAIGDYLYIENHGFMVVGWGPFESTIGGITYANDNPLASLYSSSNPIPYVADFCYGTKGSPDISTPDNTGWLQDPRPRPFYATATQVYQDWLRADQIPYLKKRVVPGLSTQPIAVYDNFTAGSNSWRFYKIPDTIKLSVLPLNRLYFKG